MQMEKLKDCFEVPGEVLLWKNKKDWIKQAREAMNRAESYGAFKLSEMKQKEREELIQALDALKLFNEV
jgi:hypothetical protein